jgi:acetylornithine/succinyldiaminopimelate/putrescine aminotransferase
MALHLGSLCLEYLFTKNILQNVKSVEGFWHGAAHELRGFEGVVAVRSVGSLLGVELETPERSEAVFQHLLEHGKNHILCKRAGRDKKTLVFWMMLNLSEEICSIVFEAVKEAIACTC